MKRFNLVERKDAYFSKGKRNLIDRNFSTIEFNLRILTLVDSDKVPIMEKLKFLKIVRSNLDEFIGIRLPDSKLEDMKSYISHIEYIQKKIKSQFYKILEELSIGDFHINNVPLHSIKSTKLLDDNTYHVTFVDNKFIITPASGTKNEFIEKYQILHPNANITVSFFIRLISNKSIRFLYSDSNNTKEIIDDIESIAYMKEGEIFQTILTTCNSKIVMDELLNYLNITTLNRQYIYTPFEALCIGDIEEYIEGIVNNPAYFEKDEVQYTERNYLEELKENDIMIHNPFESYNHVLDFIKQVCYDESVENIFITLYRLGHESEIIKYLIKAKQLGKNVNVFIEPTARGNEIDNINNIHILEEHGINVACNYFNYKVHSKLFCGVTKDGIVYCHVGTGNYNENTAKFYTDLHLFTLKPEITIQVMNIFYGLFTKKMIKSVESDLKFSPVGFRPVMIGMIKEESMKGDSGRIIIKCNSLCDSEVINALYDAADMGVKIRIICRTACSITPTNNIEVISKIGRYLEHERFYIIGDRYFISSADLLLRNISKRVEVLCEIKQPALQDKIYNIYDHIWNRSDYGVFRLDVTGKWINTIGNTEL